MIVAGLENQDSSFFKVESKDITGRILTEDIISFRYTEEVAKFNSGSLSIYDPDHYYSKVLRFGAELEISFGYYRPDLSQESLLLSSKNPFQVFGGSVRSGIKAYIQNPNGSGSSSGIVTFNCNFYGRESLDEKNYRIHTGINKGTLVLNLLNELGCEVTEVNFTRQGEILNSNTQIPQRETNYRLLLRLAYEWRCIFKISSDAKGRMTGVFISPEYIGDMNVSKYVTGAIGGNSLFLEYKSGIRNVIEYSWKNHAGEGGNGDNTRIVVGADGNPTFVRYVTEGQTVKAYRLNTDRIKERLEQQGSFSDRLDVMTEWLSTTDFEEVKWAFDPVELSTAPQGLGYSVNAKIMGNPMIGAPIKVYFGEGFPVWFTPDKPEAHVTGYYSKSVNHTIDRSGYKIDLEILDAYTATGGSFI